jgi:preprotein translocase subunit SecY
VNLQQEVPDAIVVNQGLFWFSSIVILTAGTLFCMWIGERITDKGIGNGISFIIMVGIVATFPAAISAEVTSRLKGGGGLVPFVLEIMVLVVIVMGIILLVQGTRRIPVQYAKRVVNKGGRMMQMGGVRNYLPLKLNQAGVMPIIFAQAIMFIPATFATFVGADQSSGFLRVMNDFTSIPYNIVYALLILAFTYFYTALVINPINMADELKRNGGFIPGVKPGRSTAEFIDTVMSRITLPGSIFLALVAIMPAFAQLMNVNNLFAAFFGGSSMLIMIGVILDTLQMIESYLLMRHYDGLTKTGRIKGRTQSPVSAY